MQTTRLLTIVLMLCQPTLTLAQPAAGAGNLGDHPLLDRFPDSTLEEIEVVEDANYSLVLGSLRRQRQEVVPENSARLRGDVTKLTYQASQNFTGGEVYEYFVEQLDQRGYEVLYSCTGRGCGSSNYWANDIFGNRILYGPERNQYFMAVRVGTDNDAVAHMSIYVITRANRRIYAYVEIVEEEASEGVVDVSSPELLAALNAQGGVALPMIVFDGDERLAPETNLAPVVDLLQSDQSLQYYVVAHLGGAAPLETLIQRSTARAEVLRQALIERGVNGDRLVARGVGPLAPVCNIGNCAERAELVLRLDD
ncbi:MAG: DUF4892 domain-containing protein [Pseudohongiellaceae bacterium]